jgi:hypothetical protein
VNSTELQLFLRRDPPPILSTSPSARLKGAQRRQGDQHGHHRRQCRKRGGDPRSNDILERRAFAGTLGSSGIQKPPGSCGISAAVLSRGPRHDRFRAARHRDLAACAYFHFNCAERVRKVFQCPSPAQSLRFFRRKCMPKDSHQRAAEFHDLAAQAHRVAATHHGKEDHKTGREFSRQAMEHSSKAHELTLEAVRKSESAAREG